MELYCAKVEIKPSSYGPIKCLKNISSIILKIKYLFYKVKHYLGYGASLP